MWIGGDKMNKEYKVNINLNYLWILGIVFVVLKLCKVIQWSWLWVLAPFWISAIIFVISFVIIIFLMKRR